MAYVSRFFFFFNKIIYLIRWQKAEHTLGHDLADVEQQRTHLVLKGKCFGMLKGGTEFFAAGSSTNSADPHLKKKKKSIYMYTLYLL